MAEKQSGRTGIDRRELLLGAAAAAATVGSRATAAESVSAARTATAPATGCFDRGRPSNALVTGVETDELVLFAFDDHWLPLRHNLALKLERPTLYGGNPVLRRGGEGEPDHFFASLYGTVFLQAGKFRMWYGAVDSWEGFHPGRSNMRLAYAESDDGIHWVKPKLGLREYRGSKDNNLLAIDREVYNSPLVLFDPDEPDANRRYKMTFVGYHHENLPLKPLLCVAFSPDGLRWTCYEQNPVVRNTWAETSGLCRWNGIYYCNGQTTWPATNPKRTMVGFASSDFVHWQPDSIVNFHRHPLDEQSQENVGAQVHLGASLWHRRSVLLGLYGKWENDAGGKSTETRIDLGLIISNDGLVFREPVPGFRFIAWGSEPSGWQTLRLLQAQAFVNHGDKTYIWYGAGSDPTGKAVAVENQAEVGLATLERDRFGHLAPTGPGAMCTSQPLPAMPAGASLAVNVAGLGDQANLRLEILDAGFVPISGHSGPDAVTVDQSGLRSNVAWNGGNQPEPTKTQPWRVRVHFEGQRSSQIRLYALYVRGPEFGRT